MRAEPLPSFAPRSLPVSGAERAARASGLAVTVLLITAGVLAPDPPMHGGTEAAILAHYRAHHDGILAGAFVWTLAIAALLLFALVVARAAERRATMAGQDAGLLPGYTRLLAGAAAGMLLASQAATAAAAVIGQHATDTTVVRGIDEIAHMLAHLAMLPLGLLILACGLTLRTWRVGARWLSTTGAAIGAALAASACWVFVGGMPLHQAGVLCLFAMLLWLVAQSVSLLRADGARSRDADAHPMPAPLPSSAM